MNLNVPVSESTTVLSSIPLTPIVFTKLVRSVSRTSGFLSIPIIDTNELAEIPSFVGSLAASIACVVCLSIVSTVA